MLSNAVVQSASLRRLPEGSNSSIPIDRGITSMAAAMLAADRIAANVMVAKPELRDALY